MDGTLTDAINTHIIELNESGRERYAKTFAALSSSLSECFGENLPRVNEISTETICQYLQFLKDKRLKFNTIQFYFRALRALCSQYIGKESATNIFRQIDTEDYKLAPEPEHVAVPQSVEIQDVEPHWFASKMFVRDTKSITETVGTFTDDIYLPVFRAVKRVNNKVVETEKSLCQLMFFRCKTSEISDITASLRNKIMVYTTLTRSGRRPSVISDYEMRMFRLITDTGNENLEYFTEDLQKFHEGQRVRVIAGEFEGAEGTVVRIKKDRRLVVSITGICAVATPHLPPALLQEI